MKAGFKKNTRMKRSFPRHQLYMGLFAALAALTADFPVQAQQARAESVAPQQYSIAAGELGDALNQLAAQSHLQIVYAPELVQGKTTPGINGQLTWREVLEKLLAGSGLEWSLVGHNLVAIRKAPPSPPVKKPVASKSPELGSPQQLATVTVTGNLRAETYGKYAGSIAPITGVALDQIGAQSMQDYLGTIPGVSFAAINPGFSNITIRGIGTTTQVDQGQQTTGIYIDGIPLTEAYFNMATPDIDTFDVDRVEVLKGPQGTAFGTGAMGGAVNYIPNKPDTGSFDDRFQLGLSDVDGNGSLGHVAKAMLNIPVSNDFAVRLVLDDRRDPGYIDNLGTQRDNANTSDVFGGRLLATWQIDDKTSLNWMTLYQRIKDADASYDDSTVGVMKSDTAFPQYFDTSALINTLNFKHAFAWADLSITASSHKKTQSSIADETNLLGALLGGLATPLSLLQGAEANGHTAEARLTSNSDGPFSWLVGAIYDETLIDYVDTGYAPGTSQAIDAIYGAGLGPVLAPGDQWLRGPVRVRGQQSALYSQVSWAFTPKWKLTLGGRYYSTSVASTVGDAGLLNYLTTGSTVGSLLAGNQKADGFSPMGSLSYQATANTMLYGLISTGFRFGGPNTNTSAGTQSTPSTFGPDKLTNYELGVRTSNDSKSLTAGVTTYFIDWKNIQLRTTSPQGLAYEINAGEAYSYGLEGNFDWRPNRHFQWNGSMGFNQAKLVDPYQQYVGKVAPSGTPLPGSSKWQASSAASYYFGGDYNPFITATFQYRSKATVDLFDLEPKMGNYSIFGLRSGFSIGSTTFTAYIDNIGNKKGISNIQLVSSAELWRNYITPRTIGVLADFSF